MRAIEILFMFFTAVIAGDFKKAHGLTSKTWAESNGPDVLKKQLGETPDDLTFDIDRVITELPTEQTYAVVFSSNGEDRSAKVTLIREAWPGKRNAQGDWGVDPDLLESDPFKGLTSKVGAKKTEAPKKPEPQKEAEKEVPGPDPGEYAQTLAKAEDMGIEIPEGTEPSLDDLKDMIFLEQEKLTKAAEAKKKPAPKKAPAKKAPAKKPAAKKPAAKKGGAK